MAQEEKPDLVIIHFNDVYDCAERKIEPVGGAARFSSAVKSYSNENPLILFSGDVFNPSIVSTVTKGKHMVSVLNILGVQASVYGNHDFDFGVFTLEKYANLCNFPWIMSNVNCIDKDEPIAGAKKYVLMDWKTETTTLHIGLIGIVEEDWLATIQGLSEQVRFLDPTTETRRLAAELKSKGADMIIVLSHMRQVNDEKLARNAPEVDLILGGHDHFYEIKEVNNISVVKSGTDFRNFSVLRIKLDKDRKAKPKVVSEAVEITAKYPPDPEMIEAVRTFNDIVESKMGKVIGTTSVELDARSKNLRTREVNLGNFVCDVIRSEFNCDVVILNSGTIRSDATYGPGPFTMRDLLSILPFPDEIMLIEVTGQQIWEALENGVSKYPAHEGRFPQVSGIKFSFDPTKQPGERVISVEVGGNPIDESAIYSLATKTYIALAGADGYTMLQGSKVLVSSENAKLLPTLVRQYFQKLEVLNGMKRMDHIIRNAFRKQNRTWKSAAFMLNAHTEGRIVIIDPLELQKKYEAMTKEELIERCLALENELNSMKVANHRAFSTHSLRSPSQSPSHHLHY